MSFKTIDTILKEAEDAGTLRRFVPLWDPDESEKRELFLSPGVFDLVHQENRRLGRSFGPAVRGFLKRFVVGGPIDNKNYMKSWRDDVFALRVQIEPRKHPDNHRIFGGFVKQDCFVALNYEKRGILEQRNSWDFKIGSAIEKWEGLFGSFSRVPARPFSNCVSANFWDLDE